MRALFFALGALLFIWLFFPSQHDNKRDHRTVTDKILHPFDSSVRFRLGDVDPRFGMSQAELIQLCKDAIGIWQQGSEKPLLVYDPNAKLTINLIYDQRQADHKAYKTSQQLLQTAQNVNQRVSENLDNRYNYLEQRHQQLQAQRDQLSRDAEQLNQQRMSWMRIENENGPNQQRIEQQYQQLKAQAQQLDHDIAELKDQNNQYNQQVEQHNQNINSYNINVNHLNQRFPAREFHKGIYNGKRIEIYQFDTMDDLRLTIAHELGHALGLEHNHDPQALMYPLLKDQQMQNFRLSAADLALLQTR